MCWCLSIFVRLASSASGPQSSRLWGKYFNQPNFDICQQCIFFLNKDWPTAYSRLKDHEPCPKAFLFLSFDTISFTSFFSQITKTINRN